MYFNNVTIFKIYNYLNINDLFNCSLINKQFNNIFNCDLLWKNIIATKYSDINIDEIKKQYNIINFKYICKKIIDLLYLNKTLNLNKTVKDLINLKKLYLSYNQLKEIPKEIGSLINLQYLYLTNNKLKEIPREIGSLINLKIFIFD
jgi:Leucine-rich repeat (LRR) protein